MNQKPLRILLVDDDADNLANLSDILAERGHSTESACCGEVALEKMANGSHDSGSRFDLCVLDFKMPGMNGVELVEQIRLRKPHLRSIMITAYAGDDGMRRALEAGASKVLSKPVDVPELLRTIDESVS